MRRVLIRKAIKIMKTKLLSALALIMSMLVLSSCGMFRDATVPEAVTESESAVTDTSNESEEAPEAVTPVIPVKNPDDPLTVCVDAGHGFTDPGCTTDYLEGLYEREIVAEYAEALKTKLEEAGCRVIMLRDNDNFITAETVAAEAKKLGVSVHDSKLVSGGRFAPYNRAVWANVLHRDTYIDVFISLHIDSYEDMQSVRGTRVYYCSDTAYSLMSKKLCDSVSEAVKNALPDTNARSFPKSTADAYVVTKHTEMPSVLVEIGFATNPDDAKNILDETWRGEFCDALVKGIEAFAGEGNKNE